jgi:hypothetical protein
MCIASTTAQQQTVTQALLKVLKAAEVRTPHSAVAVFKHARYTCLHTNDSTACAVNQLLPLFESYNRECI